jgi:hypothetical protein
VSLPVSQLGWMAGVLDVKGRIQYKNNQRRATRQIVLAVESTEHAIVKELSRMTGTNPEHKKIDNKSGWYRRGCEEHCDEPHIHVMGGEFPSTMRWTITGSSMVVVLDNVEPFLTNDRGFMEAKFEAIDQAVLNGRGGAAAQAGLRRLYDLGWDIPSQLRLLPAPKELTAG